MDLTLGLVAIVADFYYCQSRNAIQATRGTDGAILHDYFLSSPYASDGLLQISAVRVAACEPQVVRSSTSGFKARENYRACMMTHHSLQTLLDTGRDRIMEKVFLFSSIIRVVPQQPIPSDSTVPTYDQVLVNIQHAHEST